MFEIWIVMLVLGRLMEKFVILFMISILMFFSWKCLKSCSLFLWGVCFVIRGVEKYWLMFRNWFK